MAPLIKKKKIMAPIYRRFFKIMAPQFQNQLIIPKHFMERFQGMLGNSCILRGPSGTEWWVHVRRPRGSTSFSEGWSGFVVDHGVNIGDYLVFTYTGNSSFKVSIYDPATQIERPSALLAHNSSTSPPSDESTDDDHDDDVDVVHIDESDDDRVDDGSDSVSTRMSGGNQGQGESSEAHVSRVCTRAQTRARRVEKPTTTGLASRAQTQPRRPKMTATVGPGSQARGRPSTRSHGGRDEFGRKGRLRTRSPGSGQLQTFHISKRRKVTWEEIEQAQHLAASYRCYNNNHFPKFEVTLLPSNVYFGFYLTIPKAWAFENTIQKPHDVELKVVGQPGRWTIGCRWSKTKQCQFRSRWARFVRDNNLEEHDVCVFELVHAGSEDGHEDTAFNVHIFRVVEPPEPVAVERRRAY